MTFQDRARPAPMAVIPAYNEASTIAGVVAAVRTQGCTPVVVDDGSSDRTAANARAAGAVVLSHPVNSGVGAALRTGFAYAVKKGATRVIQVDGDGQHDPTAIPDLLAAADSGHDLVIGTRFGSGGFEGHRMRRVPMRLLAALVSRRTRTTIDDATSGFRVISEPLLSVFAVDYPAEYLSDTVEAVLLASRRGASITQVPVEMAARSAGDPTSSVRAAGHLLRVLLAIVMSPRTTKDLQ
ncbi:MAG: glycosyltransferase family 2 protein [Acidimicrobiia bacterium]|nr:glycosyltransferase family 2 protein [Acidimicrobiia bacterium]